MQRYFMQLYFVCQYLSDREKMGTKFSNSGCTPTDTRLAKVLVPPGGTSRGTQLYWTYAYHGGAGSSSVKRVFPDWVQYSSYDSPLPGQDNKPKNE